jgi:competence protein ComEA
MYNAVSLTWETAMRTRLFLILLFVVVAPSMLLAGDHIDVNKATAADLMSVKGVGPATAKNIIAYRTSNGPFKSLWDLTQVQRLGAKTVAKLACKLYVPAEGPQACGVVKESAKKKSRAVGPVLPAGETININLATAADISRIKGFGPKKSAAVVAWRTENGWFLSVEDLQDVKGIGPKTVERLRPVVKTKVDINAATKDVLEALGFTNSKQILELRKAVGRFASVKDLKQVPEIDMKALARVKRILEFGPRSNKGK